MTNTKQFHIGDIISVTSGRLVSPDHIGGVDNILGWMVDEDLMTHQLPRVSDECAPTLRALFPDLSSIEVPDSINSEETLQSWLASITPVYGLHRDVPKLARDDHARIDPVLELQHMVGADRVIAVEVQA